MSSEHSQSTARGRRGAGVLAASILLAGAPGAHAGPTYAQHREALVAEIREDVTATAVYLGREQLDPRVLEAIRTVPRHEFVPAGLRDDAYANKPLPIGHGQTISQPYVVAIMTDLLDPRSGDRVLEIGTGSGYQAAVAAELVQQVYSIEIVEPLHREAAERLGRLGYDNVHTRLGDGYYGWPEAAPFDGILVTAAAGHIPPPLVRQLAPGGRMVIPVGNRFQVQQLTLVEKDDEGRISSRQLLPVRFVPFTGGH